MTGVRLTLIVLKTTRLERLKEFYAGLGLDFVEERHGAGPTHFSAQVGGVVVELYPLPAGAGEADATTRLGFAVPDLETALRAVGGASSGEVKETAWGRRAVVRDPDGRAVELSQDAEP